MSINSYITGVSIVTVTLHKKITLELITFLKLCHNKKLVKLLDRKALTDTRVSERVCRLPPGIDRSKGVLHGSINTNVNAIDLSIVLFLLTEGNSKDSYSVCQLEGLLPHSNIFNKHLEH